MPENLQEGKMLSIVCKTFNYKDTVNNTDKNENRSYETVIASCDCDNSMYLDNRHGDTFLWEICE